MKRTSSIVETAPFIVRAICARSPASPSPARPSPAAVERQKLAEDLVVGDVCGPTVSSCRGGVKGTVARLDEPASSQGYYRVVGNIPGDAGQVWRWRFPESRRGMVDLGRRYTRQEAALMARQTRRWNPGDAANAFVRVILSDAGARLGGLTETEWERTLDWFGRRCAYTGDALVDGQMDRDHAIPMNRAHCGLHLYGNVLPATKEANRQKADKHYQDFLEDPDRLDRIQSFIRESRYWERVSVFRDLQRYCEAQYRSIDALCRVNRQYLASLLPEDVDDGLGSDPEPLDLSPVIRPEKDLLPITLDPPTAAEFKDALLRKREARIFEIHRDGRTIERRWNASNISESSNAIGNLRSHPRYRRGAWKRLGIQSLMVSVKQP